MYLFNNSGPLTLMKLSPHSLATAEASRVLPQPGNPYRRRLYKQFQLFFFASFLLMVVFLETRGGRTQIEGAADN